MAFCFDTQNDCCPEIILGCAKNVPSRFKDIFITSTIGHRDDLKSEDKSWLLDVPHVVLYYRQFLQESVLEHALTKN